LAITKPPCSAVSLR